MIENIFVYHKMMQSRKALFYQAASFVRSNPPWCSSHLLCLSSIPLKNQGGSTPEDLSKLYKTPEEYEDDDMSTRGLRGGACGGPGAVNVGNGRMENAGERWRDDAGEPRETSDSVAQTAKVAAVGAVETGLRLGKMAKQAADGLWEAAEKTAENVKDSVADDTDDGRGRHRAGTFDELDNSGGRPSDDTIEKRSPDDFVKDLRRRSGGYDLKDRW